MGQFEQVSRAVVVTTGLNEVELQTQTLPARSMVH